MTSVTRIKLAAWSIDLTPVSGTSFAHSRFQNMKTCGLLQLPESPRMGYVTSVGQAQPRILSASGKPFNDGRLGPLFFHGVVVSTRIYSFTQTVPDDSTIARVRPRIHAPPDMSSHRGRLIRSADCDTADCRLGRAHGRVVPASSAYKRLPKKLNSTQRTH